MTTFYRLLKDTDKGAALETAVQADRSGAPDTERTFKLNPEVFSKVPNTPFAYWVDEAIRDLFVKLPPFESEGRTVRVGLQTGDDFRFVRAWWEVDPARRLDPGLAGAPSWREDLEAFQDWCRRRTHQGKYWAPFAKGGEYSPYYSDIHLVVNWKDEGREMKAFSGSVIRNPDYYFRPGVTWPVRAARFTPWPMFAGSIPSVTGYAIYLPPEDLNRAVAVFNSTLWDHLFKVSVERFLHPKFLVGVTKLLPWPLEFPTYEPDAKKFLSAGRDNWIWKATCNSFCGSNCTDLSQVDEDSLSRSDVNAFTFEAYRVTSQLKDSVSYFERERFEAGVTASDTDEVAGPQFCRSELFDSSYASYAMGRWDIRVALSANSMPRLPDPFDPLPVVPPATLVSPNGLPATSGNIVSEQWLRARPDAISLPPEGSVAEPTIADSEYPITVPWDGILVDDPDSDADIVARIRAVLAMLHGERAEAVEHELCAELGVETLRDYISSPKGFFEDHLKRYSKSRRKAPIYWPLSTKSGGYTVWVYYPRLSSATLFTVVDRYIRPKQEAVRRQYEELARVPPAERSKLQQKTFDRLARDNEELAAFADELLRVANLPYEPDHDDGVPICAAPLHRLFRHKQWANYLAGIWKSLERGEFDWAHLAFRIWPDRVRAKAAEDRSIAIAHGLEDSA